MENSNEIWQTDLGGQVFETTFEELTQWIAEGTLLPQDKIRRGNLRWIEAGKVPSLHGFFNAKELGIIPPSIKSPQPSPTFGNSQVMTSVPAASSNEPVVSVGQHNNYCVLHAGHKAAFLCEVCTNYFCADCPQNSGNAAVICPMCGAHCQGLSAPVQPTFQVPTPATAPVTSFNPKPRNERAAFLPAQNLQVAHSLGDVNNLKSSGTPIFVLVLIALLFSGAMAYLWAYQIVAPDEEAEKKLPKILLLEENLKKAKEEEERSWNEAQAEARRKKDAELALHRANLTSGGSGGGSGCFDGMTRNPMPCDPSLEKFRNSMAEKYKDMNTGFQPAPPNLDQFTQNFRPPSLAQEGFDKERKQIIDDYRRDSTKQRFLLTWIGSFVALFGLMLIKRKFSKK